MDAFFLPLPLAGLFLFQKPRSHFADDAGLALYAGIAMRTCCSPGRVALAELGARPPIEG